MGGERAGVARDDVASRDSIVSMPPVPRRCDAPRSSWPDPKRHRVLLRVSTRLVGQPGWPSQVWLERRGGSEDEKPSGMGARG